MACFRIPKAICEDIEKMCSNFWWGVDKGRKRLQWKNWKLMCIPKSLGGMGFRKIDIFNKALLAKQIWRMITKPESLLARVLKSRYFRHCDVMEAEMGHNPSYVWRSLLWSRELLSEGLMWRVGNGKLIKVPQDKWIPSFENNIRQILNESNDQALVQSLISNQQWNVNTVKDEFPTFVASEIVSIPLPATIRENLRFWRHDKKGKYSVREGYMLGVGLYTPPENQSEVTMKSWWKFIWSLSLPPKVRIFWWKIYHDAIATCWNLLSHQVSVTGRCPLCNYEMDTTSHALFSSVRSKEGWKHTEFYSLIGNIQCHDSREICCWLKHELGRPNFEKTAICTWAIWKKSTSFLHNEGDRAGSPDIGWCLDYLGEFQNMKMREQQMSEPTITASPVRWLPPPVGSLRLDVDVSLNTALHTYAIGGAVRDHQGKLLCTFGQKIKQPLLVTHGELITLYEGLKILYDRCFQGVHVASDSLMAVQTVTKPYEEYGYMGTVADEVKDLIKEPMVLKLFHIRRSANTVAHNLTKFSILSPTPLFCVS